MREFKFRVWDENNQEMIYGVGITPEGIPYSIPDYAEASDQFNYYPSCHKMQFTGVYDKNDNEIYEGDILEFGSVVTYVDSTDQANLGMEVGYYSQRDNFESWRLLEVGEELEVLGNIYEKPDLLNRD